MKKKYIKVPIVCLSIAVATLSFAGCSSDHTEGTVVQQDENKNNSEGSENNNINGTTDGNSSNSDDALTEETVKENAGYVITPKYTEEELSEDYDEKNAISINLTGDGAECDAEDVTIDNGTVTISKSGTYVISGSLTNGNIVVDSSDDEIVQLVLAGADITATDGSAIFVRNAEETIIILKKDTENTVTDAAEYSSGKQEEGQNAAIYSKDDLTINGSGSLRVNAQYNHGIQSKDDLLLISGNIEVDSVGDAIVGKDSVIIKEADITIHSKEKGIKGTGNKAKKGYVYIENAMIDITSEDDGIHTDTIVQIDGGKITIDSGDDGIHADIKVLINDGEIDVKDCYEGIEGCIIIMNDGDVKINASDDGINATNGLNTGMGMGDMNGGKGGMGGMNGRKGDMRDDISNEIGETENGEEGSFNGQTGNIGDRGEMNGGKGGMRGGNADHGNRKDWNSSNEDRRNGQMPEMPDGEIPDMPNGQMPEMPNGEMPDFQNGQMPDMPKEQLPNGQMPDMPKEQLPNGNVDASDIDKDEGSSTSDNSALKVLDMRFEMNGGSLYINAKGDGLDSNGNIVMTGGKIVVDGPENNGNGAIDYENSFEISGGEVIAAGSSGMAMTPSSTSSVNSVMVTFSNSYNHAEIVIKDTEGNTIVSYTPVKTFNSFVYSGEALKTGETYTVYADGEETDSFTVSQTITNVGAGGGFGGFGKF